MKTAARRETFVEPLETRIAPAFVSGSVELGGLSAADGSTFTGSDADGAGFAVAATGDVNGDGFGDFIVGLPDSNGEAGGARVIFGKGTPFSPEVALGSISQGIGFELVGVVADGRAGRTVAAAGDVNGARL